MKNKTLVSLVSVAIVVILIGIISTLSPLNGYYNSVEQVRAAEELYDSATIIHTQHLSDKYVDFIVDKDNYFCVIEIDEKKTLLGQKYIKGTWSSKHMSDAIFEDVSLYHQSGTLDFTRLPSFWNKPNTVLTYCFAPADAVISDENIETVVFVYDDSRYLLCMKLESQE